MDNYVVSTCTSGDITKEHLESRNIECISFHYALDGKQYVDDFGKTISYPDLYDAMVKGADTKTAVVEGEDRAQFVWTEGDDNNFYVYENGVEGTVEDVEFTDDMRKATLSVSFTTAAADKYVYTAKFADNISNHGNPKLSAVQYPSLTSYDQFADILVSEPLEKEEAATSLKFFLKRKVTVNKMTLKGLANGETVSKVVLSSTNHLSGYYSSSNTSMTGDGKELTMQYSDAAVSSTGEFPVYFVAVPKEGHTLTVVVETSRGEKKYSYTKSFGSGNINFATKRNGTIAAITGF